MGPCLLARHFFQVRLHGYLFCKLSTCLIQRLAFSHVIWHDLYALWVLLQVINGLHDSLSFTSYMLIEVLLGTGLKTCVLDLSSCTGAKL